MGATMRSAHVALLSALLTAPAYAQNVLPNDPCPDPGDLLLREYPAVGVAPLTPDEADKIKKWEQCERKYRQDGPAWASERAGQYFCYVEQSAGIWEKDGKKYAGPINIPDKNQKFFIRIEKEIRTNMTKAFCSK